MIDVTKITDVINSIDLTMSLSSVIIIALLSFIIHLIAKENKRTYFNWTDMIIQSDLSGRRSVSLTKVLQLVGGITSTWVIMVYALKQTLSSEMFFTYLTYVGAIEGWSKFVSAKYGNSTDITDTTDTTPSKVND